MDLTNVRLQLRVISLTNTPEGFISSATSANNTQNEINRVDFVAHDSNQARLKRQAQAISVTYVYKRGDKEPDVKSGFSFREAAIAAACSSNDLRLAVIAKRYVTGLWEDTTQPPYSTLFNAETDIGRLWNATRLSRVVDSGIATLHADLEGRDKLISIHSNRFVLFCLFRALDLAKLDFLTDFDGSVRLVQAMLDGLLKSIIAEVNKTFPDAYPGNVFKNFDRQKELLEALTKSGKLNSPKATLTEKIVARKRVRSRG